MTKMAYQFKAVEAQNRELIAVKNDRLPSQRVQATSPRTQEWLNHHKDASTEPSRMPASQAQVEACNNTCLQRFNQLAERLAASEARIQELLLHAPPQASSEATLSTQQQPAVFAQDFGSLRRIVASLETKVAQLSQALGDVSSSKADLRDRVMTLEKGLQQQQQRTPEQQREEVPEPIQGDTSAAKFLAVAKGMQLFDTIQLDDGTLKSLAAAAIELHITAGQHVINQGVSGAHSK